MADPVEGEIDELALWSQVTSNARLDDDGNLVILNDAEWSEARAGVSHPRAC